MDPKPESGSGTSKSFSLSFNPPPAQVTPPMKIPVYSWLLFAVLFSGLVYLGYQNWQMKQEISQAKATTPPVATITPAIDPTVYWKTFHNAKVEFTFKYPEEVMLKDTSVYSNDKQKINIQLYHGYLNMTITSQTMNSSDLKSWVTNYAKKNYSADVTDIEETTINSLPAIRFAFSTEDIEHLDTYRAVAILNDNIVYLFKLSDVSYKSDADFSQILSTFKFTDETSSSQMNGWESYSFSEIGLAFQAPKDLTVEGKVVNNSAFTLYIQNNETDMNKYYQLYVIAQWQPKKYSESELNSFKADLVTDSIREVTIGGHKGISGQINGERNRYVTYFIRNGALYSAFTSQPTKENEELSNQILSTFKFTQ